jgi:hypothetical protein
MSIVIEQEVAASDPVPEQESNPRTEGNQPRQDGLCANPRCRKGSNDTRGVLRSPKAKYCCDYCRVAVCRRKRKLRLEQTGQLKRKRRKDAKWNSPAERKRNYEEKRKFRRYFFSTYWIPSRDKIPK